jgi:hypothetical protein
MKFLPLLFALLAAPALLAQEPAAAPGADAVPTLPAPKIDTPPISLESGTGTGEPATPKLVLPVEEPLLPVPSGPILDQGGVLQPDAVERLTAILTAARAKDVWVYMLTVRSLRVLPSRQQSTLEALAKRYVKAWTPKTVGAVVIFDDEGGLMFAETSEEADQRFSDVAIRIALEERMSSLKTDGLARDKLEKSAQIIAEVLCQFQTQYMEDSRRQLKINVIMGGLALLGAALAVWSAFQGSKNPTPANAVPDLETKPPPAV